MLQKTKAQSSATLTREYNIITFQPNLHNTNPMRPKDRLPPVANRDETNKWTKMKWSHQVEIKDESYFRKMRSKHAAPPEQTTDSKSYDLCIQSKISSNYDAVKANPTSFFNSSSVDYDFISYTNRHSKDTIQSLRDKE